MLKWVVAGALLVLIILMLVLLKLHERRGR
jgi:hypothetical protein